jgi:hypothetical protein
MTHAPRSICAPAAIYDDNGKTLGDGSSTAWDMGNDAAKVKMR